MRVLRRGDTGARVKRLQRRLNRLNFNPGKIDGDFGPATEAAVLAFQRSDTLLPDGIVGPRTARALGLERGDAAPSLLPHVTVAVVSRMFPHTPLDNIIKNLPFVLTALEGAGLTDRKMALMALATIRAETESFEPVSEAPSRFNTSPGGRSFDLYDSRQDLGNHGPPDGERYRGRGFVQLTGRKNYQEQGRAIGLGKRLVAQPELANDPAIASKLLASFLKTKKRPIKEALLEGDLKLARKLVNGGTHGLNRFVEAYRTGERLLPDELSSITS